MATIKVTYNSISRRFNIASPNWVELESKLRSLYNIPTTSSLIVSYNDEDGDVITLSSDLELKEILDQQSSSRPIKLILSTVENLIFEDENDNDVVNSNVEVNNNHVDDFSSLQQNQQQTTELEEENVESRPPSYYQHVTIEEEEPEDGQSTPLLNKEKEKESEKQRPESTNENKENEDDDDDEIIFVISYPWARQTFFGPRFGPRFGPGFGPGFGSGFGPGFGPGFGSGFGHGFGPRFGLFDGLFDGPRYFPFSPFNSYGRPQFHRSAWYGCPSAYHFSSRQCGPNSCNENSKPSCCSKQQQSDFCNKNSEASTSASAKTNRCNKDKYNHRSRFSCGKNSNLFYPQCYNNQPTFTQEQLNEKLSTLHSMGFESSNNALYEDLLKRYNGNLERVIELLLRNQQVNEYYDNEKSSKKRNGIVINEEKPNNDEIKHVDNEESKPYNL